MKNHFKVKLNVGLSSFVVVFVVLCLVTFSILSLSTAVSNKKLVTKSSKSISNYYKLTNKLNRDLIDIENDLVTYYKSSNNEAEYYNLVNSKYKLDNYNYSMVIKGKEQSLQVTIRINYPKNNKYYTIINQKKISNDEWESSSEITIM